MANIFLEVEKKNNTTEASPARDYQAEAYLTFMSNEYVESINFKYPGNIVFEIKKFSSKYPELTTKYPNFCIFVHENKKEYILSDDKDLLNAFIAYRTRILSPVGGGKKTNKKSSVNRKKKTNRKKLSKRK